MSDSSQAYCCVGLTAVFYLNNFHGQCKNSQAAKEYGQTNSGEIYFPFTKAYLFSIEIASHEIKRLSSGLAEGPIKNVIIEKWADNYSN